jgi:hypothetical protein
VHLASLAPRPLSSGPIRAVRICNARNQSVASGIVFTAKIWAFVELPADRSNEVNHDVDPPPKKFPQFNDIVAFDKSVRLWQWECINTGKTYQAVEQVGPRMH